MGDRLDGVLRDVIAAVEDARAKGHAATVRLERGSETVTIYVDPE